MSAINLHGNARRDRTIGSTRREALSAGILSLLGGFVSTPAIRAIETPAAAYRHTARAKSVVLIYLQGGPPTQDMFDLKPGAPEGIRSEFKPIASSASGIDVCELLPLTARWMHTTAVVRSVFHNGGCHKNLPMYTGFDVSLLDEDFRDTDPPSMGSVCAYVERDNPPPRCRPTSIFLVRWAGVKHARKPVRTPGSSVGATIPSAPNAPHRSTTRPTTSGLPRSSAASPI